MVYDTNKKYYRMILVAIMAALSVVMYLFFPEIPIVPGVSHLRIDLSDIPAVITGMVSGPWLGAGVIVLKNLLHVFKADTFTFGVGELVNIIVGSCAVLSLSYLTRLFSKALHRSSEHAAPYYLASVATIVIDVVIGVAANLALTPVYLLAMGIPVTWVTVWGMAMGSILLNALKISVITLPLYPVIYALRRYLAR